MTNLQKQTQEKYRMIAAAIVALLFANRDKVINPNNVCQLTGDVYKGHMTVGEIRAGVSHMVNYENVYESDITYIIEPLAATHMVIKFEPTDDGILTRYASGIAPIYGKDFS